MTNKKRYIIIALISFIFIGVGLYNPKVEIDISSDTINNAIDKSLPIKAIAPIVGLNGFVDELNIKLLDDGTALIDFDAYAKLDSGTNFSAKGTASSKLWYEDGKIYLEDPWVEDIHDYDYELQGKEKAIKDAYRKGQNLFNKATGKHYTIKSEIVEKAKDKLATALEYVPVYNINFDNSIKGWLLQQATGDVIISQDKVTAVLYPFGLMLKGIVFGSFIILLTIAGIRNPELFVTLMKAS